MSDNEENFENDAIGNSVYSKKWIIQCLLKVVQFVDIEPSLESYNDESTIDDNNNLGEIEEQLCMLWDMSSNEDVQSFLKHYESDKMIAICAQKTNSPRLGEILIGILGNLAHNSDIAQSISMNTLFCDNVILWLNSSDVSFLTQLVRFLNTILHKNVETWHSIVVRNSETFFSALQHLLFNCLNVDLLKLLLQYINQLLYSNSDLIGKLWLEADPENECILSLCQACFQIVMSFEDSTSENQEEEWNKETCQSNYEFFYHFWFINQMLLDSRQHDSSDSSAILQTFASSLSKLKELFFRFKNYYADSTNALLSYSAACSLFSTIFNHVMLIAQCQQRTNIENLLAAKTLKESMSQDQLLLATHKMFTELGQKNLQININNNDEMFGIALSNLKEFDHILL